MLKFIAEKILSRGERKVGVPLNYAREILSVNFGLFSRYGKIFSFLDPVKHVPQEVYHAARLAGAVSADCGSCVKAEVNLARSAGLEDAAIGLILRRKTDQLDQNIAPAVRLAFAVAKNVDDAGSRSEIVSKHGKAGLIELSYAMNGAAMLPGIKRAMGFATACNIDSLNVGA